MAYNRVVLKGSLGGGAERWSCGLNFGNEDNVVISSPGDLGSWANGIMAKFAGANDWAPVLRSLLGSNGTIDSTTTYFYPFNVGPSTAVGESSISSISGANSLTMPPQCSLVFSLLTGVAGRRTRGRIYWPCLTSSITAGLKRGGNPTQVSIATAAAEMLSELAENPTAIELFPAVVSKVGQGQVTRVTSVSVGDVIDTQRSRRDALQEIRVSAPIEE